MQKVASHYFSLICSESLLLFFLLCYGTVIITVHLLLLFSYPFLLSFCRPLLGTFFCLCYCSTSPKSHHKPHLTFIAIYGDSFDLRMVVMLHPRAYLMCHAFIRTYILLYMSRVSLMCTIRPPCHSYQIFSLSRYLAALDSLTYHSLPAYLGHASHARAAPLTHTVGSKIIAIFGYFALHAMWSLIAWE